MSENLFQKVWKKHCVGELADGRKQIFIGLHLIHEVTSPQAFSELRERGLKVAFPHRTFATVDHIIPTDGSERPFKDKMAEAMISELQKNTKEFNIPFFDVASKKQGIVHVIGPELGLTQPGLTICCGDSHTSTHGAFGSIAFGIGTSQVRDVLATGTLAMSDLKVRRINVNGKLSPGVSAKDVILYIIWKLGVNGGNGYAYEYGGSAIESMSMDARMTLCNMSIEGGARVGYVNPDQTTFSYLEAKPFAPSGDALIEAKRYWRSIASDENSVYDDVVDFKAEDIEPMVTWGINPGQASGISGNIPDGRNYRPDQSELLKQACEYMKIKPGEAVKGKKVDVAFIGSCTNSRITDLREVARHIEGHKVKNGVKALVVPGSMAVDKQAREEGLREIFLSSGFEWRLPGCSMCLAMNPDRLIGDQLCASSSNRNFKGRQGSSNGRTVLMSPLMVAAAAVTGEISDAREVFSRS